MGTFANSEDPDEMQHKAVLHQGLLFDEVITINIYLFFFLLKKKLY